MKTGITMLATLMLPSLAIAHPGHDHSHWTAGLSHGALFAATLSVAAAGLYLWHRKSRSDNTSSKKDN